jgi:hypothetical protein
MRSVTEGQRTAEDLRPGSDRNFGLVMAAAAAIFGCLPLLGHAAAVILGRRPLLPLATPHWWLIGVAVAFAALAFFVPRALYPLNYVWFRFGLLLHRVMSPLIIGAVFFLCVTPIGLLMRLFGKDVLSLRRRTDLPSYWIVRDPPGPEPGTMTNQF